MRVNLKAAVIAALVALLVGGGTATAARLITGKQVADGSLTGRDIKDGSIGAKDISRKALASLRGKAGPQGATGAAGPTGAAGAAGAQGAKGDPGRSALSSLATNETVRGVVVAEGNAAAAGGFVGTGVSLPIPAPVALDNGHVNVDGSDDPGDACTGTYANPTAPAGFVCVYINTSTNLSNIIGFVPFGQVTRFGFAVDGTTGAGGNAYFTGSWAYTAP
jgi:hypothetical protein